MPVVFFFLRVRPKACIPDFPQIIIETSVGLVQQPYTKIRQPMRRKNMPPFLRVRARVGGGGVLTHRKGAGSVRRSICHSKTCGRTNRRGPQHPGFLLNAGAVRLNSLAVSHVDGPPVKHAHEDCQAFLELFGEQDLQRKPNQNEKKEREAGKKERLTMRRAE